MLFSNLLRRYRRQRWLRRRSRSPHLSRSASVAATTTTSYLPHHSSPYQPSDLYDRLYAISDGEPEFDIDLEWPADLDLDLEPSSRHSSSFFSSEMHSAQVVTFVAPQSHRALRCPVCLEPFENRSVSTGNCLHLVHTTCLSSWFRHDSASSCPVCRLPLSNSQPPSNHHPLPNDVVTTLRAQSFPSSLDHPQYFHHVDSAPLAYGPTYLSLSDDHLSSSTDALSSPFDDTDNSFYDPCTLRNHVRDCTHHHYHHHHIIPSDTFRDESVPTLSNPPQSQHYARQRHHHHVHHHHHHHHLHAQRYANGRTTPSSILSLPDDEPGLLDATSLDDLPRPYVPLRAVTDLDQVPSIGPGDDVAPWRTLGAVTCDFDQMSSGLSPHGRTTSTSMTVQRWLETVNST